MLGDALFEDHNVFREPADAALKKADIKLAAELARRDRVARYRQGAQARQSQGRSAAGPFEATVDGKPAIVEYDPDSDLCDTEQVPLLEDGDIETFIRREVQPYTPDTWITEDVAKIG
jgi:type I restriction enzyme M protein